MSITASGQRFEEMSTSEVRFLVLAMIERPDFPVLITLLARPGAWQG